MKRKTYKYELTVSFESESPVELHDNALIQFENGLGYFLDTKARRKIYCQCINSTFVYGSGKTKLKKLARRKNALASQKENKYIQLSRFGSKV